MHLNWLAYGIAELKYCRSLKDLGAIVGNKLPFLLPRITGNPMVKRKAPIVLQIEPTNHCNISCICCSRNKMKREKGFMEMGLFRKIINEASLCKVKIVHLYLHGEPMLHPELVTMVRLIKEKNMGITIATNGMHCTSDMSKALLTSGLTGADRVIFSVLGHSKEVHEKVMRGADHETVINNIRTFLEIRKEMRLQGPIAEMDYYIVPENRHEVARFIASWKKKVDHVAAYEISKQFSLYKSERHEAIARTRTCKYPWERITVFWNGEATTCMADIDGENVLGNLRDGSIRELWSSAKFEGLRGLHAEKRFAELSLCSKCDW